MSVATIADEKLESAKTHVRDAIKDLSEIVVQQCQGHDEFNSVYRNTIKQKLASLIEIRDELDHR